MSLGKGESFPVGTNEGGSPLIEGLCVDKDESGS